MPVRICDRCRTYFIAGVIPEPDTDTDHCRGCSERLRCVPVQELHEHVQRLRKQQARGTPGE